MIDRAIAFDQLATWVRERDAVMFAALSAHPECFVRTMVEPFLAGHTAWIRLDPAGERAQMGASGPTVR